MLKSIIPMKVNGLYNYNSAFYSGNKIRITETESIYCSLAKVILTRYAMENNFDYFVDYILPETFLKKHSLLMKRRRADMVIVMNDTPVVIFFDYDPRKKEVENKNIFSINVTEIGIHSRSIHKFVSKLYKIMGEINDKIKREE